LAAISLGLSRNYQDDLEMLKHGMVMYDASTLGARKERRKCIRGSRKPTVKADGLFSAECVSNRLFNQENDHEKPC